jgi:predicted transcriptional regulator
MAHDIKFIRLDDDICDRLNRWADATNSRVSDLANVLIRMQLRTGSPSVWPAAPNAGESNLPNSD